jgi:hypothetical protein
LLFLPVQGLRILMNNAIIFGLVYRNPWIFYWVIDALNTLLDIDSAIQ